MERPAVGGSRGAVDAAADSGSDAVIRGAASLAVSRVFSPGSAAMDELSGDNDDLFSRSFEKEGTA